MKDFQIQWQLVLTNVELRNEMGGEGKKAHLIARQVMHNEVRLSPHRPGCSTLQAALQSISQASLSCSLLYPVEGGPEVRRAEGILLVPQPKSFCPLAMHAHRPVFAHVAKQECKWFRRSTFDAHFLTDTERWLSDAVSLETTTARRPTRIHICSPTPCPGAAKTRATSTISDPENGSEYRLCCTNHLRAEVPLLPDRPIPRPS